MAALIRRLSNDRPRRGAGSIDTLDDWMGLWGLGNLPYFLQTTMGKTQEVSDNTFIGLVAGAYLRNSVVFTSLAIRARLFAEARFQFQQLRGGRPGQLFGTPDLRILERPEANKSTPDMLSTAILDADIGGNSFQLGRTNAIRRLRPDWTVIAYGSKNENDFGMWDPDAEVIGFGYWPGGQSSGNPVQTFLAEEVAHFAPTKDPLARNRGISLLYAGMREILADNASTSHKLAYFENAATPNLALSFPAGMGKEKAKEWIEIFEQEHRGASHAFKTIYLGSGVQPTPIGQGFKDMDYAAIQGRAETRIAALTGMHPVVAALSEGLQGSSLNAGNFGQAARLVGDATLRPLWRDMAGALETIVPPLPGSRLWYDDRDVAFLRDDVKDQAEILELNAKAITAFVKEGFEPGSAVDAVSSGDLNRLVHTGLVSVQLQPPTETLPGDTQAMHRAKYDFWASSEPLAQHGRMSLGATVPSTHPMVKAFPEFFEPAGAMEMSVRVRQLFGQGRSAPQIAAEVERSERHVRRLLAGAIGS